MPYFGVDDGFAFHRKALKAGNAALGLWVRAGSWCNQQLTDGYVPLEMVAALGTKSQAERLVKAGLWDETADGYQFHEWSEEGRNFTRAEVLAKREKERDRKARQREANSTEPQVNGGGPSGTPTGHDADTHGDVNTPIPSHPSKEEKKTTSSSPRKRGARLPDDFAVTAEMRSWFSEHCPGIDGRTEHAKFVDYWTAKTGRDATKLDWEATWRNWMRNAKPQARASPNGMHSTDANIARLMGTPLRALPGGQS